MLYRELNALGRPLSVIGFGGGAISGEGAGYGFGPMSEKDAEVLLQSSWDAGINLYDTAPIYGFGLSEERFGKYLPKDAIIVTKGGVDWHSSKRVNMSNDPAIIEKMLQESLKRLKREYIDIYMIHWPDERVDIRRAMEVLKKYQDNKIIGHLGLCNTNLNDLALANEIASVTFLQSELNAFNTQAFEQLENEWKKFFTMSWGTLDKGILSGRVNIGRKFEKEDCRSWAPWWKNQNIQLKLEKVESLKKILSDYNISLVQFALNFNLNFFGLSSCLIGVKNNNDLVEVTSNLHKNLTNETMSEVMKRWNN